MSESLFSTYWYRVAELRPRLSDATTISRHVYRDQPWYILSNRLNQRNHRFNAAAYTLIGQMDGKRTVQEIWDNAGGLVSETAPTQDEFIRLLGQLHDADLIQSDILPSTMALVTNGQSSENYKWKQRAANPFSLRFPLVDPDRFLDRWRFLTGPAVTRTALILWSLIVMTAMVLAVLHWPELADSLSDQLDSTRNLVLLWMVYPLVKILHEFGHACAVKKWGGEVHEMGVILLALTPIPYIDASTSATFTDKRQRIIVSAMGMAVEMLLASLALFVWLNVESGLISAIAYNIMLIGGVSTVLFNGNPLLRYDGYYILADLIEIPNLAQRANRYLGYFLQRYLLGIESAESPVTARGERGWFLIYGPIAFVYRMVVLIGLVLLVSSRFFILGILIAAWGAFSLLILPAIRRLTQFLNLPAVRLRRSRLIMLAGAVVTGSFLLLFILPVPLWTSTQGVVWLPEQSSIRAGTSFEVVELLAPVEQWVDKDTPLIRGVDPFIDAQIEIYHARLEELYASYNAQPLHQRVERRILLEEIALLKKDLQHVEDKREKLTVSSPVPGKFILIDGHDLSGRFVKQGELLGYMIADHRPTVRAVVSQADIGLVRERISAVEVRLAEQSATTLAGQIERIVPAADLNLPSPALGTSGGGNIPVDPTDPEGLRALTTIFQLDISLPDAVQNPHIGGRVYVRLEHGSMPLMMQWYRRLRQLFIRKFYV